MNRLPVEVTYPIQKLLHFFRKLMGTLEQWQANHQKKVEQLRQEQERYYQDTIKLIRLIEKETQTGNAVQLYCVWAGDYGATPEMQQTIGISSNELNETFDIDERERITFVISR